MALGDVIARLAVSLNLETAAFDKNARAATGTVGKMQRSMAKAATAIAGAFAGIELGQAIGAFRDMTKAALDSAGGLGEQAAQIGVSTKALQEYRFAATQVGLSTQEMELGLQQLTRRLGDAAQGSKEPTAALERLGISVDQIAGKDIGDVIPQIAAGISAIPDPAQRAAVAVDLFGKSGQKLLPLLESGAAGVEAFRTQAQQLGVVLSEGEIAKADETADKLAALNFQIEAQQNKKLLENADAIVAYEQAIGNFKLALITFVGDLEKSNQAYNKWALEFNAALRVVINGAVSFAANLPAKLGEAGRAAIASLNNMVNGIRAAVVNRLNAVWQSVLAKIETVRAAFFNLWDKVTRRSYVPDMVDDIAREMGRLDSVMVNPATEAAGKVTQAMRDMASDTRALLDRLFPEVRALIDYRKDLATIGNLPAPQQDEARRRLGLESIGEDPTSEVPIEALGQGPLVDMGGLEDSLDRIAASTENVRRGWANLKDVGASAFNELSYQLKGVLLGAQSLGDAIKNLIASLADMALSAAFKALGTSIGIPGFANGTNYAPGGLALVGERGPELVNLPRGSQVIPNHELAGMRGQQSVSFNVYANDARGGREAASQIALRMRHTLNAA